MAAPLMALKGVQAGQEDVSRFFSGLLKAAGKPAVEKTVLRRGRAVVAVRWGIPGYTVETVKRVSKKVADRPLTTRTVSIPRWAAAVVAVAGVAYAAQGPLSSELAKVKAALPALPSLPSIKPPAWSLSNPLGWANVPAWFHP